ncbi:MAG: hypothetical protein ACT6Q8_24350 [Niveispirillum sp.]|uniref:hypothetical protein n=1 Tax=Niveispirillum sp. TaxID=1917217 RepID=UPI004037419B
MNIHKRKILGYQPMAPEDYSSPIYQVRQRFLTRRGKDRMEPGDALEAAGRDVILTIDQEIRTLQFKRDLVISAMR